MYKKDHETSNFSFKLNSFSISFSRTQLARQSTQEDNYVDLYTLRTVLITVNVSISAAKMLDLMDDATDAEGPLRGAPNPRPQT